MTVIAAAIRIYLETNADVVSSVGSRIYVPRIDVSEFVGGAAFASLAVRDIGSKAHRSNVPLVAKTIEIRSTGKDYAEATLVADMAYDHMQAMRSNVHGGIILKSCTVLQGVSELSEHQTDWATTMALYQVWASPEGDC